MIIAMTDLLLDEEQRDLLSTNISLYNPSYGNDKGFMDGRMEQRDIEGQNMQIIAVGGYFSVRNGALAERFKCDSRLKGRCSKISEIHELVAMGRAVLPVGITGNKCEAILPVPPKRLNSTPEQERKRTEPISITLKL